MEDDHDKIAAIEAMAQKYTPENSIENRRNAIDRKRKASCILELMIERLSGKEAIDLTRTKKHETP